INPAKLMGLINENLNKNDVEIGQIEILKSFSFFEIDKAYEEAVIKAFRNTEFAGRALIVEVTTKPKQRGRSGKRRRSEGKKKFGSKFTDSNFSKPRRGRKKSKRY
ncbi:MAG: DbpA RNA binding domain-containing protein, partial [Bacteroidia bacterium]|nr:DbpA RNA binding domain-containing protein [Bacteroidia bacterium]